VPNGSQGATSSKGAVGRPYPPKNRSITVAATRSGGNGHGFTRMAGSRLETSTWIRPNGIS
jgi:hypothetical protein